MIVRAVEALVARKELECAEADPAFFTRLVLPCWTEEICGQPVYEEVAPDCVVGAHYQGYPAPAGRSAVSALFDTLDAGARQFYRTGSRGHNAAELFRVGTLPLYVAHEGKNRVTLYRAHGRPIAAIVTPTKFLSPQFLSLIKATPLGGWLLADHAHGLTYALPFPEEVVTLLSAYGTPIRRGWAPLVRWRAMRARNELRANTCKP